MFADVTPQKENVLEKRFLNLVSPITGSRVRISFPFVMTKSYNAAGELLSSIREIAIFVKVKNTRSLWDKNTYRLHRGSLCPWSSFVVELIPAFLENLQELNGLLENSAGYDALLRWSKQFNYDAEMFLKRDRNGVDYQSFQNTKELLVEHILQVVYNNSVVKPAKLNLYPPSTSSAYGETSFQMVEEMIRYLNITSNDSFLDLGSGVGQVVLHVAAATQCRVSVGIECREWPIFFARAMNSTFQRWMNWYGVPYQSYELLEGDFMDEKFRHYINEATIIFTNNIAFTPELNYQLEEIFLTLNDGVRIVSSRKFAEPDQRLNARNMNDFRAIVKVESLGPAPVSWTSKPLPYFVHTIDRQKRAEYLASWSDRSTKKRQLDDFTDEEQ